MIEDTAFVVIWATLPFLWHYLLKAGGISLRRLTIPGFVILAFYGFQYIGLPVLYFQLNEFRAAFVHDKLLVMRVFFYTALTITLMIFGYIAGRKVFGPLQIFGTAGIRKGGSLQIFSLLVLFGICLSVLLLYVSKIGLKNVALLTVLGFGDDVELSVARSAMGNAFEGKYHWYHLFMNKLLLFCVCAIFTQYLLKSTLVNRVLFGIVSIVAMFSMTMAIEKGPMANLLIALFLVYVLVKKGGEIPVKGSLYFGVVLLSVLVLFYISFMDVERPGKALFSVASRVFTGQIQPAYHYLEYFPHYHNFLLGSSFPNPGGVLPFKHYYLTLEMMNWFNPEMAQLGIVGSMPTVFWGEMHANFGFLGVALPPFFVGFILYWLNHLTLRLSPSPAAVALFVWLMMHFKNLSGTPLSGYFFDIGTFATIFFFFLIAFISGKGVVKLQRPFPETPVFHE